MEREIENLKGEYNNACQYEKRLKELENEREKKGAFQVREKREIERRIEEIKANQEKMYIRIQERYKVDVKSTKDIEKQKKKKKEAWENIQNQNNEWFRKNQVVKEYLQEQQRSRQQEQEQLKREKELQEQEKKEKEEEKEQRKEQDQKKDDRNAPFSEEESLNRHIALLAMHSSEVCADIKAHEQMEQYVERGSR